MVFWGLGLFLILLLHRTTTRHSDRIPGSGCSLFSFYIEPQHEKLLRILGTVVPYSPSTSNHNYNFAILRFLKLFLILLLHRTTTCPQSCSSSSGCSLFSFCIEPQLISEHLCRTGSCSLFSFYIEPQLSAAEPFPVPCCSLFSFYIEPQRMFLSCKALKGCSLFSFYIEPQRQPGARAFGSVVPYSPSTSNHNSLACNMAIALVVPYSPSTSNHNNTGVSEKKRIVVPYSPSTSNHNLRILLNICHKVVPYSPSTSNHN